MSVSNRLAGLKARPKNVDHEELRKADDVGEARGFLDRTPRKKPGRKPSPGHISFIRRFFPISGRRLRMRPSGSA